jgi:hypothetical protein
MILCTYRTPNFGSFLGASQMFLPMLGGYLKSRIIFIDFGSGFASFNLTFIMIEILTYIIGLENHIIIKIGIYLKLNDHWFWKLVHALLQSVIFSFKGFSSFKIMLGFRVFDYHIVVIIFFLLSTCDYCHCFQLCTLHL